MFKIEATQNRLTTVKRWLSGQWSYAVLSSLAVLIITLSTSRPPASSTTTVVKQAICQVLRVTDGDSLSVSCDNQTHRLRLMYIDAPEIKQQPWGEKARVALQALVKQQVFVAFHGKDVYHRDLALIYSDEARTTALNLTLVKQGAVRVYSRYQPPAEYMTAMQIAKQNRLGIWQRQGLHQDPQRYRRLINN